MLTERPAQRGCCGLRSGAWVLLGLHRLRVPPPAKAFTLRRDCTQTRTTVLGCSNLESPALCQQVEKVSRTCVL
jgi:hypothetical protein